MSTTAARDPRGDAADPRLREVGRPARRRIPAPTPIALAVALAAFGLAIVVAGIAAISLPAGAIVGGLFVAVPAVGYLRGATARLP